MEETICACAYWCVVKQCCQSAAFMLATCLILQIFLQALCHLPRLSIYLAIFSLVCCLHTVVMSEKGSSEAFASDTKSVALDVDDFQKFIKETVHEELATEKSSVPSILKFCSKVYLIQLCLYSCCRSVNINAVTRASVLLYKYFNEMNSYVGVKKDRDKMIISIIKAYFSHYQPTQVP